MQQYKEENSKVYLANLGLLKVGDFVEILLEPGHLLLHVVGLQGLELRALAHLIYRSCYFLVTSSCRYTGV